MNCIGPRSCYDEGKRAAEALCMDYHRQHSVELRALRAGGASDRLGWYYKEVNMST